LSSAPRIPRHIIEAASNSEKPAFVDEKKTTNTAIVEDDVDMEKYEEIEEPTAEKKVEEAKPIEEEPLVSGGLSATLALLKQKGT
jgi:hypothetical protein